MDSEPGIVSFTAPVALGLVAFAAIVLSDGTEDLSFIRFLMATVVLFAVTGGSVWALRQRFEKQGD